MNEQFFKLYVVLYKNEIMILKTGMSSQVMRQDGSVLLTCEIAPISQFEIIGEF